MAKFQHGLTGEQKDFDQDPGAPWYEVPEHSSMGEPVEQPKPAAKPAAGKKKG
jgi:hypothetical protein